MFFFLVVDHEARVKAATSMATENDDPAMAKSETEDDQVNAEVEPPTIDAAAELQREEPEPETQTRKGPRQAVAETVGKNIKLLMSPQIFF